MGKKVIIYIDHCVYRDGVYKWIEIFCKTFKDIYNITLMSKVFYDDIQNEFNRMIKTEIWNKEQTYTADALLITQDFVIFPTNIFAEHTYKIVHCNYAECPKEIEIDLTGKFIAVSEQAAEGFKKRFNKECDFIDSFVIPYKPQKVLRLISCTRIYEDKGIDRMYDLAEMLHMAGVEYQWINYTEIDKHGAKYLRDKRDFSITQLPGIPHRQLLNYIADADYLVQLSKNEGYCYAVHESLMVGTPVIVTDIPAFTKLIQNGVNGYKIPLNMDLNFIPLGDIITNIPKGFKYENNIEDIKKRWEEVL